MSRGLVRAFLPLLFCVCAAAAFAAPQENGADPNESLWLEQWPAREAELYTWKQLQHDQIPDDTKLKAMEWLRKDVDYAASSYQRTQRPLGEAYGEYYIELVLFVAHLKDRRAIPVLADTVDVAPIVWTTLAEFGDEAVPYVVKNLAKPFLASDAAHALGTFARGRTIGKSPITEKTFLDIRDALLRTLDDRSFVTRKAAVNALEHVGPDPLVLAALQRVSRTDPYVRSIPAGKRNAAVARDYPVRNAAGAVLLKLERRSPQDRVR
jgi:hypothetical protein